MRASLYKGALLFRVLKHLAAGTWDCGHVNGPGKPTIPSWHVKMGSTTSEEPTTTRWVGSVLEPSQKHRARRHRQG